MNPREHAEGKRLDLLLERVVAAVMAGNRQAALRAVADVQAMRPAPDLHAARRWAVEQLADPSTWPTS